jgi:hypothetical protein
MATHRNRDANTDAAKARAEAVFKKKEQQRREGQSATDDYLAKQKTERDKTARLRTQRLDREATKPSEPAGKGKSRSKP